MGRTLRQPWLLAALLSVAPAWAHADPPAVAFFYGKPVPITELSHFDWVVVEAENLDAAGLAVLRRAGVEVFAYLSLGEAAPGGVEQDWVVGRNAGWGTVIVDPAAEGWRQRVQGRADTLWRMGYRGLFLDTLDSYLAAVSGAEARRAAATALAGLVEALHRQHPEMKLFFNRGFEILDQVGRLASGLAAESLFFGWDPVARQYVDVPEADREWLAGRLRKVAERLKIPLVVVDYLPPERRPEAREGARRIEAMGFSPWVSTPSLDVLGVGSLEVIPRRVLLVHDGAEAADLSQSAIHRLAALPVESLGYAVDYLDVRRGLPPQPLAGRYAGIVTWFTDDELPDSIGYPEWLGRQMAAGVRVAILGRPGFAVARSFLGRLGLSAAAGPQQALRVARRDGLLGFEAEPTLRNRGLMPWRAASDEVVVHLRLEDAKGLPIDPVVTAPWGGMALDPYVVEVGYQGRVRWIVDPFAFLQAALALPPAPALDLTTENGARLLVVVADASGFARSTGPDAGSAGEVMLREVLEAVPVPTTVVIPAGELKAGRTNAAGLAGVARAILSLPNVEVAARLAPSTSARGGGPGATRREVENAVAYARGLSPARKPPRAFVWPAGRPPAPEAVAAAAGLGLASLAAGSPLEAGPPSLGRLSPSARPAGGLLQVRLPGWSGGWSEAHVDRVLQMALPDGSAAPRRLEPMGLQYQFSVAARPADLRSLKEALRWALAQGAMPLWASEYARRVEDFHGASMARRLDGTWEFRGLGQLRTVRLPRALGWPDPARSRGVASVSELGEWRYVSFAPGERQALSLAEEPTSGPYLAWANAPLERWASRGRFVSLRLHGHSPVRLAVAGAPGACTLKAHGREIRPEHGDGRAIFSLAERDTGEARLECRRESP